MQDCTWVRVATWLSWSQTRGNLGGPPAFNATNHASSPFPFPLAAGQSTPYFVISQCVRERRWWLHWLPYWTPLYNYYFDWNITSHCCSISNIRVLSPLNQCFGQPVCLQTCIETISPENTLRTRAVLGSMKKVSLGTLTASFINDMAQERRVLVKIRAW